MLIIGLSIFTFLTLYRKTNSDPEKAAQLINHINSVALFTLAFAALSQILGLVDIFSYLANKDAHLAASVLAQGIKLTFHPMMYGLMIYLVSILIRVAIGLRIKRV